MKAKIGPMEVMDDIPVIIEDNTQKKRWEVFNMNTYDAAHQLASAIKNSEEYNNFLQAYRQLQNDSTANNIFNDFRNLQLEVQQYKAKGEEAPADKEEKLNKMAEAAQNNLTVKNFIEAEYRFANIIKDVQQILAEAIEIEGEVNKGE